MQRFHSRRFAGGAAVWVCAIFVLIVFAAGAAWAEASAKAGKKAKGGKRKQMTGSATPTASPTAGEQSLTNIPLPIGHEAKGLTLPDFDVEGHLRGKFIAGTARRIDQDHVGFKDLKITTFKETNEVDLEIEMPTSVLDLTTRILRSQDRTTVRRADFNIVGDSAVFDTATRTSRMIGNVKMVITDQSHLMEKPNE
jgi:hypothetical protein